MLANKSGRCCHDNPVPHFLHRFEVDAVLGRIGAALGGIVFKEHA